MSKKQKVYQCECCKNIITNPFRAKMKEFYYSDGFEKFFNVPTLYESKCRKKITLCNSCYTKIGTASNLERL